jgi:hypothetical protein
MGWVVSVTPRPRFTPGERTPGTHWTGGWVGPRAGLDTEVTGKVLCPCRGSNLDRPVVQSVARHRADMSQPHTHPHIVARCYFFYRSCHWYPSYCWKFHCTLRTNIYCQYLSLKVNYYRVSLLSLLVTTSEKMFLLYCAYLQMLLSYVCIRHWYHKTQKWDTYITFYKVKYVNFICMNNNG